MEMIENIHLPISKQYIKCQIPRSRPLSATMSKTSRDPNWMKLFHPSTKQSLKFKPSTLSFYPQSHQPTSKEIQPKFVINITNLYKSLIPTPNPEGLLEKKSNTLQLIPEFNAFTERNVSLSRLSSIRPESAHFHTARPSTASNRNIKMKKIGSEAGLSSEDTQFYTSRPGTAGSKNIIIKKVSSEREFVPDNAHFSTLRTDNERSRNSTMKKINSEKEFLPDKGNEFASEIMEIWDTLRYKHEEEYEHKEKSNRVRRESYDTANEISLEKKHKFGGIKAREAEHKGHLIERKDEKRIEEILEEYQDQIYMKQQRKTVELKIQNLPKESAQDMHFQGPPPVFTKQCSNGSLTKTDKSTRQIKENEGKILWIRAEAKVLTQRPLSSRKVLTMKSKSFKLLNANQSNNA